MRSCWCDSARSQGLQKQTCRRYSDHFICSVPALSLLFFSNFFSKIETDCFCTNLPISNDPVVRNSRNLAKNSSETMWMPYHEKSEFWHREFLIIQKTIYGELQKSPLSKFYWNSVDRRDLMSIWIRQGHLKTVFGHLKHICGIHWNRSKPFTKTKGTVKFYQDVYYCKHKSFSPKLDILLLLTNCPKCFDCCFENLVLYQDNILSWWCSKILLLWGEIICSPLLRLPQSTCPKPSPTCFPWKNGFHTITEPKKIHNHIVTN